MRIKNFETAFCPRETVELMLGHYKDGSPALQVFSEDGEPILKATLWTEGLEDGELAIKDYGENEGVYDALRKAEVITKPHRLTNAGYVSLVPVCRLTEAAKQEFAK